MLANFYGPQAAENEAIQGQRSMQRNMLLGVRSDNPCDVFGPAYGEEIQENPYSNRVRSPLNPEIEL